MFEEHFCPNCGSRDIDSDVDGFVKRWRNPGVWTCSNCGYSGFMPSGSPEDFDFEKVDYDRNPSDAELDAEFGNISEHYQKISLTMIVTGILLALASLYL